MVLYLSPALSYYVDFKEVIKIAEIADKIIEVTEEMWLSCSEFNRKAHVRVHLNPKHFPHCKLTI